MKKLVDLEWLDTQQTVMEELLERWANINSHTENLVGLAFMLEELKVSFSSLKGEIRQIPLPPYRKYDQKGLPKEVQLGEALSIKKHPSAPVQVLLGGHMDTVYSVDHNFQTTRKNGNIMHGPGVADMKGGLVIMLKTLEALERSPLAGSIGWEVLITPDEEIGSPGSAPLWAEAAKRNQFGMIFEPAFSDGSLASSRKGSINYIAICRGKPSHAGRDFHAGKNAITGLARFVLRAAELTDKGKDITVNIGKIEGGGPINIVPDLAISYFNVRMDMETDFLVVEGKLNALAMEANEEAGITLELQKLTERPPKPKTEINSKMMAELEIAGGQLKIPIKWKHTGGVCDGNNVAAAGIPVIDNLGVLGGNIHTPEEYVELDSLSQRAKLSALFLSLKTE